MAVEVVMSVVQLEIIGQNSHVELDPYICRRYSVNYPSPPALFSAVAVSPFPRNITWAINTIFSFIFEMHISSNTHCLLSSSSFRLARLTLTVLCSNSSEYKLPL